MNNPRITPKERGLLKGAIRRVFSRSDLRRKVLDLSEVSHSDPLRPRVRKWSKCATCGKPTPKYLTVIDHIDPVIPVDSSFEHMSLDTVVDRLWCEEINLQPICEVCHTAKTKIEKDQRKEYKKRNKNAKSLQIMSKRKKSK